MPIHKAEYQRIDRIIEMLRRPPPGLEYGAVWLKFTLNPLE